MFSPTMWPRRGSNFAVVVWLPSKRDRNGRRKDLARTHDRERKPRPCIRCAAIIRRRRSIGLGRRQPPAAPVTRHSQRIRRNRATRRPRSTQNYGAPTYGEPSYDRYGAPTSGTQPAYGQPTTISQGARKTLRPKRQPRSATASTPQSARRKTARKDSASNSRVGAACFATNASRRAAAFAQPPIRH